MRVRPRAARRRRGRAGARRPLAPARHQPLRPRGPRCVAGRGRAAARRASSRRWSCWSGSWCCRGCRRGAGRPRSPASSCCCSVTLLAVPAIGRFGARAGRAQPPEPSVRRAVAGVRGAGRSPWSWPWRRCSGDARRRRCADGPRAGRRRRPHGARGGRVLPAGRRGTTCDEAVDGEQALTMLREPAGRPGRARPDAARHRRARGLPPAARRPATCR